MTFVGHAEIECVRPNWDTAQGCSDGGIVNEELVSHHGELFVASDAQVWGADADDGAVGDVGETFDDQTVAGHLGEPVVVGTVGPVFGVVLVGDGEGGDLVATTVEVLDGRVVGVFVGNEEGTYNNTRRQPK